MPIRNYTSKIPAGQTAGAIQELLGRSGASRISIDYDGGKIAAISFMMLVHGRPVWFEIRPDVAGMLQAMKRDPDVEGRYCNAEQAERTAWKNKYDWLDAQLAEVAAGQARIEQLLLGFAVTDNGETLFNRLEREGVLLESTNPPLMLKEAQ
jgi:hypothetical protein